MSKVAYKLRPTNYYKIGQYESWLYDMSIKGLQLEKLGFFLAKFKKSEPECIRYRLDINRGKKYLAEQDEFYTENGWSLVTYFGDLSIYAARESDDIPELHTDPVEQAKSLKKIEFEQGCLAIIFTVFAMFFAYTSLRTLNLHQFSMSTLAYWFDFLLPLIFASITIDFLIDWYTLWSTRRKLLSGKAIDHHAPWKKSYYLKNCYNVLILVVYLASVLISLISLIRH